MHCGLLRRIIFFKAVGQAMVQAVRRAGLFQILLSKPRCYAITLLGQTECTFWIKYLQWAFHVFSIFPKCNFFLLRNSLWFYIRIFAAELPNYSINKLNLFLWPLYLFVLECNLVGEFLQFNIKSPEIHHPGDFMFLLSCRRVVVSCHKQEKRV